MPDKTRHCEVEVDTIAEDVAAPQTTDQHRTLALATETATPAENQDTEQHSALKSESHASTVETRHMEWQGAHTKH